jgi:signal transduction histidine kinase
VVVAVALLAAIAMLLVERRRRLRAESRLGSFLNERERATPESFVKLHELAHLNMRAAMGELVSAVAHELNQALTASLGNAQALKRMLQVNRLTSAEAEPIIDDLNDANRHAAEIIGRIRTVMRNEQVDMRPLDLNAIVHEIVQVLHSSASTDGVELVADLEPNLPAISGDQVQLRQVAMNLALNAVQATRGQVTGASRVRVSTARHNGSVSLTVEDTGPGVSEEALPRLFEPYFTTKSSGLGVGLSISRSIVESHGGSIVVANLPKGGARFSVTLPLQ